MHSIAVPSEKIPLPSHPGIMPQSMHLSGGQGMISVSPDVSLVPGTKISEQTSSSLPS